MKIDLYNDDCFNILEKIEDNSIDLILCDPPYGTIKGINKGKNKGATVKDVVWDEKLDTDRLFSHFDRISKMGTRVILFSQEPYTSQLINKYYKSFNFNYKMIWKKNNSGNALSAKTSPLNYFEDIVVFNKKYCKNSYKELREYSKLFFSFFDKNKNSLKESKYTHFRSSNGYQFTIPSREIYEILSEEQEVKGKEWYINYDDLINIKKSYNYNQVFNLNGMKSKSNILEYSKDKKSIHPTQKPILLLEDLIKTFSNENDLILDFTMGSGSTGVACVNTNRKFIGIEKDVNYFNFAKDRIEKTLSKKGL